MGWAAGIGLALQGIGTAMSIDQSQKSHLADEEAKKVAAKNAQVQQDLVAKTQAQKVADQASFATVDQLNARRYGFNLFLIGFLVLFLERGGRGLRRCSRGLESRA